MHPIKVQEGGLVYKRSYFSGDEHTRVMIDLPRGWAVADGTGSLTATPRDMPDGMIRLEKSSLTSDAPFRDRGLVTYRQRLLASIPRAASNVRVVREQPDPSTLFGWHDYEWVVEYDAYG